MSIGSGRKYGLWHLGSSPPRRSSLCAETLSNHHSHPRTKSNGDIVGGIHLRDDIESEAEVFEKRRRHAQVKPPPVFTSERRIHRERSLNTFDSEKEVQDIVRRSASDYTTHQSRVSRARTTNELAAHSTTINNAHHRHHQANRRQRKEDGDEERRPLLTAASVDVVQHESPRGGKIYSHGGGVGVGAIRLLSPSHIVHQPRHKESISRVNSLPAARAKFSLEHSVFLEEEDDRGRDDEAKDICRPLASSQRRKKAPIWSRFSSQKRCQPAEEISETVEDMGDQLSDASSLYRPPHDRSSNHRFHKSSITSSYSPTTPSSSHLARDGGGPGGMASGRSVTRCPATNDLEATTDAASSGVPLVHANRCELYTNRAILLCILSGFVLFFVGSISFVAYVLAEKSYQDGTASLEPDD